MLIPLLAAAALFLAGCKESPAPAGGGKQAAEPVSLEKIAAEAKGFNAGSPMSARVYYVFFDAQCPHCAQLWLAAKPLKSQARFVWIPVALLKGNSTSQGAALLASPDGSAAMDGHEKSMAERGGGIIATGDTEQQKAAVAKNTELFNQYGFASVPTVVGKHAQTGNLVVQEGAMPTGPLAQALGLSAAQ
ncbi:MAG: thioredoxin fold domain-containing protein, partial [Burkholderiaceae bacterium]